MSTSYLADVDCGSHRVLCWLMFRLLVSCGGSVMLKPNGSYDDAALRAVMKDRTQNNKQMTERKRPNTWTNANLDYLEPKAAQCITLVCSSDLAAI